MKLHAVYINNIATFLPNSPIDNQSMEQVLGQVGRKPSRARAIILKSNGITSRHYAIDPVTRKQHIVMHSSQQNVLPNFSTSI